MRNHWKFGRGWQPEDRNPEDIDGKLNMCGWVRAREGQWSLHKEKIQSYFWELESLRTEYWSRNPGMDYSTGRNKLACRFASKAYLFNRSSNCQRHWWYAFNWKEDGAYLRDRRPHRRRQLLRQIGHGPRSRGAQTQYLHLPRPQSLPNAPSHPQRAPLLPEPSRRTPRLQHFLPNGCPNRPISGRSRSPNPPLSHQVVREVELRTCSENHRWKTNFSRSARGWHEAIGRPRLLRPGTRCP